MDENEGVPVPRNTLEITQPQVEQLKQSINPLGQCQNYGISIYLRVIDYLDNVLI